MAQKTDQDIAQIKSAIDANTKAITTQSDRIESIARATESNTKAISDLTASVSGLREEMRVGFSRLDGRIDNVESKLGGKIDNVESRLGGKIDKVEEQIKTSEAKLEGKINKLDERTQLGFWGFILRGSALAAIGAVLLALLKYLFPLLQF